MAPRNLEELLGWGSSSNIEVKCQKWSNKSWRKTLCNTTVCCYRWRSCYHRSHRIIPTSISHIIKETTKNRWKCFWSPLILRKNGKKSRSHLRKSGFSALSWCHWWQTHHYASSSWKWFPFLTILRSRLVLFC